MNKLVFYTGLVIFIFSMFLAFSGVSNWMFLMPIGGWLISDYLAASRDKTTTLKLFMKDKEKFFYLSVLLFFYASSAELVGRYILGWWVYPTISSKYHEFLILLIVYPFGSAFVREIFQYVNSYIKSYGLSILIVALIHIIVWEVPNLFSYDWKYTVPYLANLTVLNHINILIILAWPLLIIFPLMIYKIVLRMG